MRACNAQQAETQDAESIQNLKDAHSGHIVGTPPKYSGESAFNFYWPYREETYEIVCEKAQDLAFGICALAIFTGDIIAEASRDRFLKGVSGFHYSVDQILSYANDQTINRDLKEIIFLSMLADGGVLTRVSDGVYQKSDLEVQHVLGAAWGKKRSYELNLKHERLHVYWEQSERLRKAYEARYLALADEERQGILNACKQYNQNNEAQIIEE